MSKYRITMKQSCSLRLLSIRHYPNDFTRNIDILDYLTKMPIFFIREI